MDIMEVGPQALGAEKLRPCAEYIFKIHEDCNFGCPHCYVYEGADRSWQDKPPVMETDVVAQAATRIAEHAAEHELSTVSVVLHGGEPLMAGQARIDSIATLLRTTLSPAVRLELGIQTNGLLLSRRMLETLQKHDIQVGVSLDGPPEINDAHRPLKGGRGTFNSVARKLQTLRNDYPDIYRGILCTIHPESDPIAVYDTLASFHPPRLGLSLPYATWDKPPDRPTPQVYGNWLKAMFDHWQSQDTKSAPRIRYFESALSLWMGGPSYTEALGSASPPFMVVETNGDYEDVDSLKVTYAGAPETGLNVFEHTVDEVLNLSSFRARQLGITALCTTCQQCPIVRVCGGGQYTHRYSPKNGFQNPSVYCPDLKNFLGHVGTELRSLVARLREPSPDEITP